MNQRSPTPSSLPMFSPSPISRPSQKRNNVEKKIESLIRKAIHSYHLLDGVHHLAVALSGGKDSLTLLHLLAKMRNHGLPSLQITALHITGLFSCGASISLDELRHRVEALNCNFLTADSGRKAEELSCYPCSRIRRNLLFSLAKEAGIDTIAFGHHRDDNAETLVMNLLHKAEFAGLLPLIKMHHYGITIIRPLILVEEAMIQRFAEQQGFLRIVCRCPRGAVSLRRSAKELIDEMKERFPHAATNLASASLNYGSHKAAIPSELHMEKESL